MGVKSRSAPGHQNVPAARKESRRREKHLKNGENQQPGLGGKRAQRSYILKELEQAQQRLQTALSDVASMRQQMKAARNEAAHQAGLLTQAQLQNAELRSELQHLHRRLPESEQQLQTRMSEELGEGTSDWSTLLDLDSPTAQQAAAPAPAPAPSPPAPCSGCEALRAAHTEHLAQLGVNQQQLMAAIEAHVTQLMGQHAAQQQQLTEGLAASEARATEARAANSTLRAQLDAAYAELGVLRAQEAVEREARLRALGCAQAPTSPRGMAHRNALAPPSCSASWDGRSLPVSPGAPPATPFTPATAANNAAPGASPVSAASAPMSAAAAPGQPHHCWLEPELPQLRAGSVLVGRGGYAEVFAMPHATCRPGYDHGQPASSALVVKVSEPFQAPTHVISSHAAAVVVAAHSADGSPASFTPAAAHTAAQQEVAREAAAQLATALADLVPVFLPKASVPHLARPLHWYWRTEPPAQQQQQQAGSPPHAAGAAGVHRASEAGSGSAVAVATTPPGFAPAAPPRVRLYTVWERYDVDLEQYLCSIEGSSLGLGALTRREAAAVACSVAESLAGLHSLGAAHCDVRPANVLLRVEGGRGAHSRVVRADLADCGLLTWLAPGAVCAPSNQPGSWLYRAPEQQQCPNMVGPCCDVWQLGLLLSCLITGAPAPRVHQGSPHPATIGPQLMSDVAVVIPEGLNDRATFMLLSELVPAEADAGQVLGSNPGATSSTQPQLEGPEEAAAAGFWDSGSGEGGEEEDLMEDSCQQPASDEGDGGSGADSQEGQGEVQGPSPSSRGQESGEHAGRIQRVLARVARACLAPDPAARPSAAEVASVLQWVLGA